ncbi:hypothetical protein RHO12_11350 [Orbus sturtevantii]|uniref:hypothetical protein n=1 Tax=Orbus sturtevantii TaxID=3074109 RepID=UPI00370D8110
MIKHIVILLSMILLILICTKIVRSTEKNPFLFPPVLSCDELKDKLIVQLNLWQYRGYVKLCRTKQQQTTTVWLSSQQDWLTINDLLTPTLLMPWLITSISSTQITWQASLPSYCHSQVIFNMKFVGK